MQNKLNISLKPWENVRSAEGKHGAAHKFIRLNSSTHLPKNTLSSVADSLVVNGSDGEFFVLFVRVACVVLLNCALIMLL